LYFHTEVGLWWGGGGKHVYISMISTINILQYLFMLCNIVNMNSVPSAPQHAHAHCGQIRTDVVKVFTCLFLCLKSAYLVYSPCYTMTMVVTLMSVIWIFVLSIVYIAYSWNHNFA